MFEKKIKEKPKIDFSRNKMLQKIFSNYSATFALTLDTEDFIDKKLIKKFRKYVWRDMKRNISKLPLLCRKQRLWESLQLKQKVLPKSLQKYIYVTFILKVIKKYKLKRGVKRFAVLRLQAYGGLFVGS